MRALLRFSHLHRLCSCHFLNDMTHMLASDTKARFLVDKLCEGLVYWLM